MVRRALLPLPLLAVACALGDAPVYLKPGTDARLALREEAQCTAAARDAVPERPRLSSAPAITIGVGRCTGNVCAGISTGGLLGGDPYETDTNAGLRGEATGVCMGNLGYRLTALPRCTGSARPLLSHPFDAAGLCVLDDGRIAAPVR